MASAAVRPEWLFEVATRAQAMALTALAFDSIADLCNQLHLLPPVSPAEEQILRRWFKKDSAGSAASGPNPQGKLEDSENAVGHSAHHDRVRNAVKRAGELLRSERTRRWTVASLSRRVGCNRTDLETGFRRRFEYTLYVYLDSLRVDAAKALLRDTNWRDLEVARAVGYQSRTSLYRAFDVFLGMTPEAYRRRWHLVCANNQVAELLDLDRHCQI